VNDTSVFSNIGIAKDVLVHIDLGNIKAMHNGRCIENMTRLIIDKANRIETIE
jgi:predicted RNA-binding protein (virulence factor B family)